MAVADGCGGGAGPVCTVGAVAGAMTTVALGLAGEGAPAQHPRWPH